MPTSMISSCSRATNQEPTMASRPAPKTPFSSFPRKREARDFSRLLLGPRFRGNDEFGCPQDLLTAASAGVTVPCCECGLHCGQALGQRELAIAVRRDRLAALAEGGVA